MTFGTDDLTIDDGTDLIGTSAGADGVGCLDASIGIACLGTQFAGCIGHIPEDDALVVVVGLHRTYLVAIEQQTCLGTVSVAEYTNSLALFVVPKVRSILSDKFAWRTIVTRPISRLTLLEGTDIAYWVFAPQGGAEPATRLGERTEVEQTGVQAA